MSFNSFEFAWFLAAVLPATLLLPHRAQNRLLLVASYLFYASWDWRFCSLLLVSTCVDFYVGKRLHQSEAPAARRALLGLSLSTNLGILGFFKYAGFFAESLLALLQRLGLGLGAAEAFTLDIVLPVGISFYTFQTLSYTIDIYRRHLAPTPHFLDFALYVAFFPQLVAGPIERASRLLPQLTQPRHFDLERASSGAWLMLWGLYKKVVVADNLSVVVDAVFRPGAEPTSGEIVIACYAFSWQIYCDFSGYTDIARGVARILGFDLMLNFRLPFAAANPADFWRRWHISLTSWLHDYVYLSLGGGRSGNGQAARNLFATLVLAGLWHGAGGNFVWWGVYFGALMVAHRSWRVFQQQRLPARPSSALPRRALSHALRCFVFFHALCFGWLLFRADSVSHGLALMQRLVALDGAGLAPLWLPPLVFLLAPLIAMQIAQAATRDLECVLRWPFPLRVACYAFVMLSILTIGDEIGQPFEYFQF